MDLVVPVCQENQTYHVVLGYLMGLVNPEGQANQVFQDGQSGQGNQKVPSGQAVQQLHVSLEDQAIP